jgi:hypothetical protein
MSLKEARKHVKLAKAQWDKASVAWWEPADPATCATNVFYAYENLIVAVAEAHERKWENEKNNRLRATPGRRLAKHGAVDPSNQAARGLHLPSRRLD